jgi:hypothetical protein
MRVVDSSLDLSDGSLAKIVSRDHWCVCRKYHLSAPFLFYNGLCN